MTSRVSKALEAQRLFTSKQKVYFSSHKAFKPCKG